MTEYHVQKPEYDAPTSAPTQAAKTDTLTVKLDKRNIAITTNLTNDLNNSNLTTPGEVFISLAMAGIDGTNDPEMKSAPQKSLA
jgi:hypothetical protein